METVLFDTRERVDECFVWGTVWDGMGNSLELLLDCWGEYGLLVDCGEV